MHRSVLRGVSGRGCLLPYVVVVVASLLAGCERPPIESVQRGYRGLGMDEGLAIPRNRPQELSGDAACGGGAIYLHAHTRAENEFSTIRTEERKLSKTIVVCKDGVIANGRSAALGNYEVKRTCAVGPVVGYFDGVIGAGAIDQLDCGAEVSLAAVVAEADLHGIRFRVFHVD